MRRTVVGSAVLTLVLAAAGCGAQGGDGKGGATSASGSPTASSQTAAAAGPAWAYDHVEDGSAEMLDLAAAAEDDIWAAGFELNSDSSDSSAGHGRFLRHFDGTRWRRSPMPAVLGDSVYNARLDSVGSGEIWLTASSPDGTRLKTAHWDGESWTSLAENPTGRIGDLKAFGPDDVWVLDGQAEARHWDGSRWTTRALPAEAASLDGTASDDLWAVGSRDSGEGVGGESEQYTQPAAMHWDGGSWTLVNTPVYRFDDPVPPEPSAALGKVVVVAEDDIRAYGGNGFNHGEVENEPADQPIRLRWDGTRWTDQPEAAGECGDRDPVTVDGTRGLFLDGNRYLAADGTCVKIKRPRLTAEDGARRSSAQSLWLTSVIPVPGTDTVLGAGHVQVNQSGDPKEKAVVVSLRR
ncbi:hypothetical protein AB0D78_17930 [Streptomyces avermitilis]|uniref:hypothetical protein n=1 Tax=Streptomyces avermitilis TaxID=33903 RepID=UPI0033DD5714